MRVMNKEEKLNIFLNSMKCSEADIGKNRLCTDTSYMFNLTDNVAVSKDSGRNPSYKMVTIVTNPFKMIHNCGILGELEHEFVIIDFEGIKYLAINGYFDRKLLK